MYVAGSSKKYVPANITQDMTSQKTSIFVTNNHENLKSHGFQVVI
jgi:hypothetical protein